MQFCKYKIAHQDSSPEKKKQPLTFGAANPQSNHLCRASWDRVLSGPLSFALPKALEAVSHILLAGQYWRSAAVRLRNSETPMDRREGSKKTKHCYVVLSCAENRFFFNDTVDGRNYAPLDR